MDTIDVIRIPNMSAIFANVGILIKTQKGWTKIQPLVYYVRGIPVIYTRSNERVTPFQL